MIVLIQLAHNSPTKISLWTNRKKDLISIQSVLIKDLVLGAFFVLNDFSERIRKKKRKLVWKLSDHLCFKYQILFSFDTF